MGGFLAIGQTVRFYAFVDVTGLLGKQAAGAVLGDDLDVARYLLEEARCALVPGTAFGCPGYLRMSYAASVEQLPGRPSPHQRRGADTELIGSGRGLLAKECRLIGGRVLECDGSAPEKRGA